MSERHPFEWVRESSRGKVFGVATGAVVLWSIVMAVVSAPLENETVPRGIVDFEFAGDAETARRIIESWSPEVRDIALLGMGLDYVYLLVYPVFFSLACIAIAGRLREKKPGLARLGYAISWLVLLAGVCDAIENYGLIRILLDGPADGWARLAAGFALPKFILLGVAVLYLLIGWVLSRIARAPTA